MSLIDRDNITVTELPDVPVDAAFRSVLTAYTAEGVEIGIPPRSLIDGS